MAITDAGLRLTEAHRLAQLQLGARTIERVRSAWPILTADGIRAQTIARWLDTVEPIVHVGRRTSSELAARYVTAFRAAELGAADRFVPTLAGAIEPAQVRASLVATGPAGVRSKMAAGKSLVRAMTEAEVQSAAAAMRHTVNAGRETVLATVERDPKAQGWARVVGGDPCAFCSMLASRGPVYKGSSVNFRSHDHCLCGAEPVYSREAAWPPGSRKALAQWNEATADLADGEDAFNAYRRHLAGR